MDLLDSREQLKAWERDYRTRGRIWAGKTKGLPELSEGSRVLELGCGDGKTVSFMPAHWRVVALDISISALRLARKSSNRCIAGPVPEFMQADARALPIRSGSQDCVLAFHVAGHLQLEGRAPFAGEAARVLRTGGRLFFRDFSVEDMRAGKGEMIEPQTFLGKNGIITHFFAESELEGLFPGLRMEEAGTHRWTMQIRGEEIRRAEVWAVFLKC